MRARSRFALDIALAVGLLAAYRPTWTGISLHQWLSIAIIAPLLAHLVVNWQWTLRVLRTFVHRLLSASRLNFAIDAALLVSTVAVMLSGFMVSPLLLSPLGIQPSNPLVWHELHLWSANATIALFAIHAAMHWRWFVATAQRLAASTDTPRRNHVAPVAETIASARPMAHAETDAATAVASPTRRSRVGSRAAQAAAERAAALRVVSVLGVTGALGLAIFAGVGVASPLLASAAQSSASQPVHVASTGLRVCPRTGCKASRCHGEYGQSAETFYGLKRTVARKRATKASASSVAQAPATVTSAKSGASAKNSARSRRKVAAAAPKRAAHAAASHAVGAAKVSKPAAVKKRVMVCPHTGCTASSCHGAHHESAASYYH